MLVAKITVCILALIAILIVRIYSTKYFEHKLFNFIASIIAIGLSVTFCMLLLLTSKNVFVVPEILLFLSICIYITQKENNEVCVPFWFVFVITVFSLMISVGIYINFTDFGGEKEPVVTTESTKLIYASDEEIVDDSMPGGIFFVQGKVSEKSVFKYYYEQEDGGYMLDTIPANYTTIYYVKDGEVPHVDKVIKNWYYLNDNEPIETSKRKMEVSYELYVPRGSIKNVFESYAN